MAQGDQIRQPQAVGGTIHSVTGLHVHLVSPVPPTCGRGSFHVGYQVPSTSNSLYIVVVTVGKQQLIHSDRHNNIPFMVNQQPVTPADV